MLIFFYLFYFYFLYTKCKRCESPILSFVLLFYVFASVAAIYTHYFITPESYSTFLSVSYHILLFFLFISPIIEYGKRERDRQFLLLDDRRFKILCYSLIGLQLFSIVFFSKEDYNMLMRGDLSQIRSELLMAGRGTGSIFRTVAGVASFYYCYNILLFFYSIAFRTDSKRLLIFLILSSASRIFHSLTYMGRDGILFWILSFVSSYFIFRPYLNKEAGKFLKRTFLFIGSFAFVLLGAISVSRFGKSDHGIFKSLIDYFGEPINNFGILFDRFHDYKGTKSVLPLLYGEKGVSGRDVLDSGDYFLSKYGFANNSFKSFVGSFYSSWGPIITLIIAIFYNIIITRIMRKKLTSIPVLIVLMISLQIVIHNYFYWAYYIGVANLFLFTTPIFLFYCSKSNDIIIPSEK